MNLSALGAVPRRSWRVLGLSVLLVGAFAFDVNLVAIALAIGLGYRLVAIVFPSARSQGSALPKDHRPRSITQQYPLEGEAYPQNETKWSCLDPPHDLSTVRDKQQINPATGLFVDLDGGFDSSGNLYGETRQGSSWR